MAPPTVERIDPMMRRGVKRPSSVMIAPQTIVEMATLRVSMRVDDVVVYSKCGAAPTDCEDERKIPDRARDCRGPLNGLEVDRQKVHECEQGCTHAIYGQYERSRKCFERETYKNTKTPPAHTSRFLITCGTSIARSP